MDLSIYDVIQKPVISEKAYKLNKDLKKLVLRVHMHANKPMIKEALKKLFNVEVKNICILVRKGKNRRVGRRVVTGSDAKKAIITLAEGYSINLFDQAGDMINIAAASNVGQTTKQSKE
jgi:large subunit ribosomal protein L23